MNAGKEIRLLIVPYELGRLRDGVGAGPERLIERGAAEALSAGGAAVRQEVLELDQDFDNEIDASFELIRMISARVREAVREGAFPVVLSGSCFAAVGVVAGFDEQFPGVVWFDAHGDFNIPETTISGYFDGMGLAMLAGDAWPALLATVEGAKPLPETALLLAGARDFDEPEQERLESSAVTHLPPERIRSLEPLLEAVEALSPSPTGIYLHVDLDVLDIEEAHVNRYSAPDGLSATELESLVEAIIAKCPVRAVSLTAYEPPFDTDDAVPPIAGRLLGVIAEYVRRRAEAA